MSPVQEEVRLRLICENQIYIHTFILFLLLFISMKQLVFFAFFGYPVSLSGCGVRVRDCKQEPPQSESDSVWLRRTACIEIYCGFHTAQQIAESPLLSSPLLWEKVFERTDVCMFEHRVKERPPRRGRDTLEHGCWLLKSDTYNAFWRLLELHAKKLFSFVEEDRV